MVAISAQGLSKRYGRHNAVDNVSFTIEQGEIVGFLGPNGAGKTTTLRMLAGLITPSFGSSSILGRKTPGPSLLEVGTMIEEPSFYPYMTGRNNIKHAGILHGGVSDERIDEILAFVSMEKAADKRVRAYSQGMRQRLGLARALLWQPRVLLLDEPTNGLDPVGIAEIRENLRKIAQEGVTILISSHILAELEKLVKRVLVIEKGKLLYDGPLVKLVSQREELYLIYTLSAVDQLKLTEVLESLEYRYQVQDEVRVQTFVAESEANTFLSTLAQHEVHILEARRDVDSLEDAYLKLLREDGRPS